MPPTVAQTAPAFTDPMAEAPAGLVLSANGAWRAEYEDRRVLLPPLPPVAQDFLDELHGYKNLDARAIFRQLDDEWMRRVLLPAAPNAFEDWTWSKDFSLLYAKPVDTEPIDFARPIVPFAGWFEENSLAHAGSSGSLAAMVLMDEFVNAPSGSSQFGPAPRGRSVRFGFSISAFR